MRGSMMHGSMVYSPCILADAPLDGFLGAHLFARENCHEGSGQRAHSKYLDCLATFCEGGLALSVDRFYTILLYGCVEAGYLAYLHVFQFKCNENLTVWA
jgi:hypothetical protein